MDLDFNFNNDFTLNKKYKYKNISKLHITSTNNIINNLLKELDKLDNIYSEELKKLRNKYLESKKKVINNYKIKYNNNNNNFNNNINIL